MLSGLQTSDGVAAPEGHRCNDVRGGTDARAGTTSSVQRAVTDPGAVPSTGLPGPALVMSSGLVLDEHRPVEPAAGVALQADVQAERAVERAVRRALTPLRDVEVALHR